MKIGILTVFDAVNYGSFLQAFCLQEYLKKQGHEVVMIKRSSFLYEKWRITSLFTYKPSKFKFKEALARKYFQAWKCFQVSRFGKKFDLLIIGSDEMWEVNNITFKTKPAFFGIGIKADKKATYAVSSNSTKKEDIARYDFIKKGITQFDFISVRDKATYEAYRFLMNKEPTFCVDPTLLFDLTIYAKQTELKDYILCYTYSFKPYMIKAVKDLAKKIGKRIIVVGQQFDWADENIAASPFEFLGLIMNASFIVTDTFHGTTLSIALKKNFVAFAYKTKVYKALELFNMLDRNVNACEDISQYYINTIDYQFIYENSINPLKEISYSYLRQIIKE